VRRLAHGDRNHAGVCGRHHVLSCGWVCAQVLAGTDDRPGNFFQFLLIPARPSSAVSAAAPPPKCGARYSAPAGAMERLSELPAGRGRPSARPPHPVDLPARAVTGSLRLSTNVTLSLSIAVPIAAAPRSANFSLDVAGRGENHSVRGVLPAAGQEHDVSVGCCGSTIPIRAGY